MSAKFYQVGGSVRDELLGIKSKDIDYAVEAGSYEEMKAAILERGGEIFLETPKFLTIRANVPKFGACDYVLCRKDGAYYDGRHPESVTVGTIYDDLARRDFTVNAMARDENGKLLDPHHGAFDLARKKLSCVGYAEDRFTEDGLRMLRAIRFSLTKHLAIDDQINACLRTPMFFRPNLRGVSAERVREELVKCYQFSTIETNYLFDKYVNLRDFLFHNFPIWLKPTMETR